VPSLHAIALVLESNYLDAVFSSNFFEHLNDKDSIERTVSEAYRCLKDDGLIICLNPIIKYLPGAYWDFWDHHIPLTKLSCSEMLKMNGFSIEKCIPRFLPYSM
jgi:predicted SAM-dependent methyltransferase